MVALFWITALYVIPLIITRHLIRKLAMVSGGKPNEADLIANVLPIINILAILVILVEIAKAKSNRTFLEVFYGLRNESEVFSEGDYVKVRKEDAE